MERHSRFVADLKKRWSNHHWRDAVAQVGGELASKGVPYDPEQDAELFGPIEKRVRQKAQQVINLDSKL